MPTLGGAVHTGRAYTHPLSGDIHPSDTVGRVPSEGSQGPGWQVYAVLALALLLGLAAAGGCVAYGWVKEARSAQEALRQAQGRIEYEPLSKVNDGSYEESSSGGKARSLGVLRRLRDR